MNYTLFKAINHFAGHHPLLDHLMIFVTQYALLIYALVLLLLWLLGSEKDKYTAIYAGITGGFGLLLNVILGSIYYEPRPFVTHPHIHVLIPHVADASFPSDHTTGAFALALAVILYKRKIGVGMLLFAVLTGISRVYVGHHYPFDVLGSIVVASFSSTVIYVFRSQLMPIPRMFIHVYNKLPLVPKNQSKSTNL